MSWRCSSKDQTAEQVVGVWNDAAHLLTDEIGEGDGAQGIAVGVKLEDLFAKDVNGLAVDVEFAAFAGGWPVLPEAGRSRRFRLLRLPYLWVIFNLDPVALGVDAGDLGFFGEAVKVGIVKELGGTGVVEDGEEVFVVLGA